MRIARRDGYFAIIFLSLLFIRLSLGDYGLEKKPIRKIFRYFHTGQWMDRRDGRRLEMIGDAVAVYMKLLILCDRFNVIPFSGSLPIFHFLFHCKQNERIYSLSISMDDCDWYEDPF